MLVPTIVASELSYAARERGAAERGAKEHDSPHKTGDRQRNRSADTDLTE
jgi:hypothetical protein